MSGPEDPITYEVELWASAVKVFGDRLLEVLGEIVAGFPVFDHFSTQVITFVEPGPMVDMLRRIEAKPNGPVVAEHRDRPGQLYMIARHRAWLASGLVERLPPEALPRALIDRRMQSDVGI